MHRKKHHSRDNLTTPNTIEEEENPNNEHDDEPLLHEQIYQGESSTHGSVNT